MLLAKVTARVVSSAKVDSLPARALLEIEPLPGFWSEKTEAGASARLIAIDSVSAGPGDLVLVLQEGTGARQAVRPEAPEQILPAQMVIVGVVDRVDLAT